MIKFHISRKKNIKITVNGTPSELRNEIAILVSQVYKVVKKQYPEAAEKFKIELLSILLPSDSPVWKEDDPK